MSQYIFFKDTKSYNGLCVLMVFKVVKQINNFRSMKTFAKKLQSMYGVALKYHQKFGRKCITLTNKELDIC